jgi:anthranilate 1,2-dioxygenase small subunit
MPDATPHAAPTPSRDLMLRLELAAFLDHYVAVIDNDRLEEWPGLFTDDCVYQIIPKENEDLGLPASVIYCDNVRMLRDRVLSLRHANIYEKPVYRHFLSGMEIAVVDDTTYDVRASYVVINTGQDGVSDVYQAGRYADIVVRTPDGLRFRSKRVIYDTLRVQTLLAFPI